MSWEEYREPLTEKQRGFLRAKSKYCPAYGYQGQLELPEEMINSLSKTEASNLIGSIKMAEDLNIDLDEWELNTPEKLLAETGRVTK